MSDHQSLLQQPVTDKAMVIDYLLSNPDFFVEHGDLLTQLKIPHESGAAISLVERQLDIYREKGLRLEKQLQELLEVARENERLGQLLHQFAVSLMSTNSVDQLVKLTRETALRDFRTDEVSMQLFDNDTPISDVFADMSPSRNVICGKLSARQRALLFENADDLASVALILLHAEGRDLGVLALSSTSKSRFHPSKGTMFLAQLGNLLSHRFLAVQ